MTILGGDPEQMQTLARQFRTESGQVAELNARISGVLSSTTWTGPAAERFRQEWESSFRPALMRLDQALEQNATVVDSRLAALTQATS